MAKKKRSKRIERKDEVLSTVLVSEQIPISTPPKNEDFAKLEGLLKDKHIIKIELVRGQWVVTREDRVHYYHTKEGNSTLFFSSLYYKGESEGGQNSNIGFLVVKYLDNIYPGFLASKVRSYFEMAVTRPDNPVTMQELESAVMKPLDYKGLTPWDLIKRIEQDRKKPLPPG